MKILLSISLFLVSFFASAANKPNIILFLVDDLGWNDITCLGSTFYETPNIDKLAQEGTLFTDAYAANPVCSPTRASVMLGKYPSRIGLTNHSGYSGPKGEKFMLNAPKVVGHLPPEDTTLAEAFKEAGYTTAHIGKWHLAAHHEGNKDNYPENNGFDLNIAGHKMGQPGSFHFPYQSKQHPNTNVPDMADGKEGDYLTDALTDKAIDFITTNKDKPFFLNFWFYTVHTPLGGQANKIAKYREKAKSTPKNEAVQVMQSWSRGLQSNPIYASMVESLDDNVGRIIKTLKDLSILDNTIILFASDNGGLSTGTGKNFPTSSLPLKGGKAWVYEGGIRIPLIIRYPKLVKANQVLDVPVITTDFYPTLLDLAGLKLRPQQHLDGESLKPLLSKGINKLKRQGLFIHYPHYHHINSMGPAGSLRMDDYKLIVHYETGKLELYNLKNDMGERQNLADQMPEKVKIMKAKFEQMLSETNSLMPSENSAYKADKDYRKPKVKAPLADKTAKPVSKAKHDSTKKEFHTPKADTKNMNTKMTMDPKLPNVLIIGDSISIGYYKDLVTLLQGKANVYRPNTNCGDTNKGVANIDTWLGDRKWDLIHFNFGLHDFCYRHPDAKVYGKRDKIKGTISVPLKQYRT